MEHTWRGQGGTVVRPGGTASEKKGQEEELGRGEAKRGELGQRGGKRPGEMGQGSRLSLEEARGKMGQAQELKFEIEIQIEI